LFEKIGMTVSFRRIATRLISANLLVLPVLFLLIMLTTSSVAAESMSGTWTSNTSGKGYIQNFNVFNANYDATLHLSQNGDSVTGTVTEKCTYSKLNPGYETWQKTPVGSSGTYDVYGTVSGTTLTLNCYTPAQSGVTGGISWTTEASTVTWTLHLNGSRLTGSGTYYNGGITYAYIWDLKSGSSGSFALGDSSLTTPAIIAIIGGVACLAVSLAPMPKGRIPQGLGPNPGNNTYQPSNVTTTSGINGAPTDPTYLGGAGLQYPQNFANGVPVKPRSWQGQQGPLCPVHGTVCVPHFLQFSDDPGAWMCSRCRDQGISSGFPWGRQ
jgi:hypothetical protein